MKKILMTVAGLMMAAGTAQAGNEPTGIWRVKSGKVTVEVAECGKAYCGKIVALAKPLNEKGGPKRDWRNPEKSLRWRKLIGLQVLNNLRPDGENRWTGTIYNADDGNTYNSKVRLEDADTLVVKGCVIVFCKDMTFKRVVEK